MIDSDNIEKYVPVCITKNKVLFVHLKEDVVLGHKLSDKVTVSALNVLCLKPSQISYKKNKLYLAPSKFIPLLFSLGYSKDEYIFITELVKEMPEEVGQILDPKIYNKVKELSNKE